LSRISCEHRGVDGSIPTGLVLVAAALVAGAIATTRTIVERRRTRRVLRAKPALDATLAEGTEVRATGTVRALGATIEAPLSARRCVAYRARLQPTAGIVGLASRPKEAVGIVPFALDRLDGTSIVIESEHALIVDLPPTQLGPDAVARCERFAIARAVASGDRRRARYEEIVVEDGMVVMVSGLLMKDPVEEPATEDQRGYRDSLPVKLRLAGNADHPIVIGGARRLRR
jgi:hypothetical protein